MAIERKVVRNHEAFLSQQGKTDVATEKLKPCGIATPCAASRAHLGNQNLDEQEVNGGRGGGRSRRRRCELGGSESLTDEVER